MIFFFDGYDTHVYIYIFLDMKEVERMGWKMREDQIKIILQVAVQGSSSVVKGFV